MWRHEHYLRTDGEMLTCIWDTIKLKNLPMDAVVGSSYLGKDGQNIKTWLKN